MNPDIWINRASLVEPYDGKGLSPYFIAKETGLTFLTVKRYAEKFGFDFSERSAPPVEEMAQISYDGKNKYLGCFGTAEEAAAVYNAKLAEIEARRAAA